MLRYLLIFYVVLSFQFIESVEGQVNTDPVFPPVEPIPMGKSYDPANPFPDQWNYFPQTKDILKTKREQEEAARQNGNRQTMQQLGASVPPTQKEIDSAWQSQMETRQRNEAERQYNLQEKQRQQLVKILNEVKNQEPANNEYWKKPDFTEKTKPYQEAFDNIKNMLTGKSPLSVKDAYYNLESAYGNCFLSKEEFDNDVRKSASFIKNWMRENNFDLNNNIALHYGIQKFMTDTLVIGKNGIPDMPNRNVEIHLPFYYDFEDYKADKDFRSYHATKTFATGNGQCHTLPVVYAILAEAIGAKCYISHAPIHDFVKYPDNKGNIHNFEPTSNWQISNQWYKDYLYINSVAQKNRIYLDTLNQKEIVADAMIELAASYKEKFGVADGEFINNCVDFAMDYFPNKDSDIQGWFLRNKVAATKLDRLLEQYNVKDISKIDNIPGAPELLKQVNEINHKIESLGYSELPKNTYNNMMEEMDGKGKIQSTQTNNLKKRELFIKYNTR